MTRMTHHSFAVYLDVPARAPRLLGHVTVPTSEDIAPDDPEFWAVLDRAERQAADFVRRFGFPAWAADVQWERSSPN